MKNSNFYFQNYKSSLWVDTYAMESVSLSLTLRVTNNMNNIVYQHKISQNGWNHRVFSLNCFNSSINYAECIGTNNPWTLTKL